MNKILYLDSTKGIFGGGQISLLELLKNTDREQFSPLVILSEEGRMSQRVEELGIKYKIINMPGIRTLNPLAFFRALREITKVIKEGNFSLVCANTSRAALYAGLTGRKLGVPMVWYVRIPYRDLWLDRILGVLSTKLIVVSRSVSKRFIYLSEDKKELVFNGVDIEKFSPSPGENSSKIRAKFGLKDEDIVIGTVGRLSPEKDHDMLILAVKELVKKIPQLKVLLAGEGSKKFENLLKKKINKLGLTSHFIFAGFCPDTRDIYRAMDVFCLPSLSEGFNRSILEAFASGVPVAATSVGGNVEAVDHLINGLLFPPGHPEALEKVLFTLLKDKEKAVSYSQAGRRTVEERFNIQKNVRKIEAIYLQTINQ